MEAHLNVKCKQWYLLVLLLILGVVGCKDDKDDSGTSAIYDPSQPVTITSFTPESGAGGAQFLIYGNNFGSNLRNIKVTVNDKEAVLISSNGTCIYCFVPRKAGVGKVKVSVGTGNNTQEVVSEKNFEYIPSLVVKTLIGHVDIDANSTIKDGNFEDAQFQDPYWLEMDNEGILYLLEDYQGLRKIDLINEQVTTFGVQEVASIIHVVLPLIQTTANYISSMTKIQVMRECLLPYQNVVTTRKKKVFPLGTLWYE